MADTTTIAFNLTFLMTLGIGILMCLGHVLAFTTILVLAGGPSWALLVSRPLGVGQLAEDHEPPCRMVDTPTPDLQEVGLEAPHQHAC